eukprot:14730589-Alexandrium_andersonii.AAC.1
MCVQRAPTPAPKLHRACPRGAIGRAEARSHGLPPPRSPGRPQPKAARPGQAYEAARRPGPRH